MKTRPMLFKYDMVRAILEGRKTQTRRIIKPQPKFIDRPKDCAGWYWESPKKINGFNPVELWTNSATKEWLSEFIASRYCPYGKPGDRLWVREAWSAGRLLYGSASTVYYRSDDSGIVADKDHPVGSKPTLDNGYAGQYVTPSINQRWKPSIHMPRWASRITLEITGVRVERLQDISEEDARSEGVWKYGDEECWKIYTKTTSFGTNCPRRSFESLWQSINGPDSWDANPWVWVIEFKRL